ncbi:nucleoside hydrolase [Lapidilactobacillus wuchangensis]|uniref:nucleoside hydrolase n=1 Tax=Lapidilactobacillus wuchangensis TaxID=2486001 RepID=UPI0013DDB826|nr:nucleoside hydrolase [Lapidilactobacillus wuchangensis]
MSQKLNNQWLQPTIKPMKVILDSDAYNESDDQFEITWALCHEDRLSIQAFYAAPFLNGRSKSPEDGMNKSYDEIKKLLSLAGMTNKYPVYHGSTNFIEHEHYVDSEAVDDLIHRCGKLAVDERIYVVATGALTNIASAILKEPQLIDKLVVIWLGGQALYWTSAFEFNLSEDRFAANTVLNSKVPFILTPAMGVASNLCTTQYEINHYLANTSDSGNYLAQETTDYLNKIDREGDAGLSKLTHEPDPYLRGMTDLDTENFPATTAVIARSKVIWDLAPLAFLINPRWTTSKLVSAPIINADDTWQLTSNRHLIRVITHVDRDGIFGDLFYQISQLPRTK